MLPRLTRLTRPRPKAAEPRTRHLTARVPAPIAQAVDEYLVEQPTESRSGVLCTALEDFLEARAPELVEEARRHPAMKRPPSRQTGPSVLLPGLRVPVELEHRFVEHAKVEGITKSELMRRSLERYLAGDASLDRAAARSA